MFKNQKPLQISGHFKQAVTYIMLKMYKNISKNINFFKTKKNIYNTIPQTTIYKKIVYKKLT